MLLLLLSCFSRVWLCAAPQMAAHQAPLSSGFSRQEYWSGLPFPSPAKHLSSVYCLFIHHLSSTSMSSLSCLYHLYLSFIIDLYHIYPQEDPLEKEWLTTPVYLPGKSHGERSLASCSPWVTKSWIWTHLRQLSIASYVSFIYYLSISCLWACPVRSVEDFTVKHLESKGS